MRATLWEKDLSLSAISWASMGFYKIYLWTQRKPPKLAAPTSGYWTRLPSSEFCWVKRSKSTVGCVDIWLALSWLTGQSWEACQARSSFRLSSGLSIENSQQASAMSSWQNGWPFCGNAMLCVWLTQRNGETEYRLLVRGEFFQVNSKKAKGAKHDGHAG